MKLFKNWDEGSRLEYNRFCSFGFKFYSFSEFKIVVSHEKLESCQLLIMLGIIIGYKYSYYLVQMLTFWHEL